jgi:hypothetical protein
MQTRIEARLNKIGSSGIAKKALLVIIVIIVGGVVVGFFNTDRSAQVNGNPGASASSNAPSSAGMSSPLDSSFGLGQAKSSLTVVQAGTTIMSTMTMTATSSAYMPATTVIKPNSLGAQTSSSTVTTSAPSSSGFIEFFSNVTLRVSSLQSSLSSVMAIAYTYGGYVAYSSYNNFSSIAVLRIPAANYQTALGQVESLGNLTGFQSNSNDVSVQYTDLNATLQSLLTEQASLLSLENKSTSLNSTLIIENELQGVNTQINEIQSEILQTRILIDYSTITVTLERAVITTPTPLSLKLIVTPESGMTPLAVTFNSIVAGGEGQYIVNYNFGDGTSYQGETLIHTFNQAGTFNVTVTATDSNGSVRETWTTVHVSALPKSSQFTSFTNYVSALLIGVVEGIVEVAVVVLPIALVVSVVILPFRNKFRATKKDAKTE